MSRHDIDFRLFPRMESVDICHVDDFLRNTVEARKKFQHLFKVSFPIHNPCAHKMYFEQ